MTTAFDIRVLADRPAEEAVIAALLLDEEEAWEEVEFLTAEMIFDDLCRAAYRACVALREDGEPITPITITRAWVEKGWIDEIDRISSVGAEVWLATVLSQHFSAYGVSAHARIIKKLWERREQLGRAQEMARGAVGSPAPQRSATPVYDRPEYQGVEI